MITSIVTRPTRFTTIAGALAALAAQFGLTGVARADDGSDVGIGLAVGEPTGVSAQLDLDRARAAINLALGVDVFAHEHVHADYIFYPTVVDLNRSVDMPLYVGIGGFVKDHPDDLGPHAGVRVPIGLELDFRAPIQVYGELTPSLTVVETDPDLPHRGLVLAGAIGVRARL